MATLKGLSRSKRSEALSKGFVVDTVRGVLRVRKWPRKRGTPKSARQRWWNDWFRQANKLAKYADGLTQARAIAITKNSGMYPRDVMLAAMRGRLYIWQDQTGKKWYPMAAVQDISESLDVLAQNVGDVLVRAVDRWRAANSGALGRVLTHQGPDAAPSWAVPSSGGGITVEGVTGTPVSPDGSVALYDFDVTPYASLTLVQDGIGFAAADRTIIRFSTDGGATFKSGSSDYAVRYSAGGTNVLTNFDRLETTLVLGTANHAGETLIHGLRAGRVSSIGGGGLNPGTCFDVAGHTRFDGPITDIRIMSILGNKFNAGTFWLTGER